MNHATCQIICKKRKIGRWVDLSAKTPGPNHLWVGLPYTGKWGFKIFLGDGNKYVNLNLALINASNYISNLFLDQQSIILYILDIQSNYAHNNFGIKKRIF